MTRRLLPNPTRRRRAFTLIELMVVIGIIALMLAGITPAVVSLSKANNTKAGVSGVMNLFEQARALAVTSGHATYVVFADDTTADAYRCRALIVFQEDESFNPVAVTKWHFLPTGTAFRPRVGVLTAPNATPVVKFACPGTIANGQPIALPFIKFDSSGMVASPTDPNILFADLFMGSVTISGQAIYTDKAQQTAQKFDSVVLARFTGRARYVDRYSS